MAIRNAFFAKIWSNTENAARCTKHFLLPFIFYLSDSFLIPRTFFPKLYEAALELTSQKVVYDPSCIAISYQGGDIPAGKGFCIDVIISVYRKLGINLQKEVHEDMRANFHLYPKNRGLNTTDRNIDHRRVPNLMKFFSRHGETLKISGKVTDYHPGDIVCRDLGGGTTHIGIVVQKKSNDGKRPLIVHNIGAGQVLEDCLFNYKIIGHYRYKKSQAPGQVRLKLNIPGFESTVNRKNIEINVTNIPKNLILTVPIQVPSRYGDLPC